VEADDRPVTLTDVPLAVTFALHQVLCLTEMTRPIVLFSRAERLRVKYGYPPIPPGHFTGGGCPMAVQA
jgi:hypothetical protein